VTQRRQYLLFFGLVVGVMVAAYAVGRQPGRGSLLDAVPRDAWLVVHIDAVALRQSALAKPVLGNGDKTPIPGLGGLAAQCGFDPVSRLKEIVVTSPENGERGEFAVAFTGDFTKEELQSCAEKVIRARGGTPATSTRTGFTLVEDTGDEKHARLGYREGGPFLVGRGAWLDATIDAVVGKGERANPDHATLRAAIAPKDTKSTPAIVATALLPATVRDKLKAELGSEATGPGEKSFAGVLGVSALGLAVSTGGPGSTTDLTVEMRCESASACDEVDRLIERKRTAFARDIGVRLIGLGPLLDSLHVGAKDVTLTATASAPTDDVARALQRVLDLRGHSGPAAPAASP
jgi:hypothetical protein